MTQPQQALQMAESLTQSVKAPPTWPLFWDKLPLQLDPEAARHLIMASDRRNRDMLAAVVHVRSHEGIRAARRLQRRYLMSLSAKLAAVTQVWSSRVQAINECSDEDVMGLVELADSLSAWMAYPERALAWPKMKRDGENYRVIHKLNLRHAIIDKLSANAARPFIDLLPTQFSQRGKGIIQCEAWLGELMPKVQTVMTVDIPSCFDVVCRSSVEVSLFLPKRVVEAAMFHPMDNAKRLPGVLTGIAMDNTHDVGTSAAKRGVPQGSALAQLAADIEVDKVLRAVAAVHGSVHVAAHGDNLIFLLEDAGWLGSVKAALTDATTKQFGSDVTTALVYRIRCDKPSTFAFCRRTYHWRKGKLVKNLPAGYIDDFAIKTMTRMADAFGLKDQRLLESCGRSVMGFLNQHAGVSGAMTECVALLVSLQTYKDLLIKNHLQQAS